MEKHKPALEAQGAKIIAASVDDLENAKAIAADLTFPVAYGVSRAEADALGAWWGEQRGGIMQPSEGWQGFARHVCNRPDRPHGRRRSRQSAHQTQFNVS